jgi:hypothetical protein
MILVTSAAAAALLCWLASAVAQTAPTTAGPVPSAVIEELVLANRILNDRGVLDAYGHVSIRHPSDPGRYLMARAIAPGLVTAEDIMEFDLESNPVDRRGRSLFVERFIHGEAYKSRPDINSVIHTHSAGVIPFSVTPTPLRPVIHNASFLHVGVPVWNIRDAGGATNMLVRDGQARPVPGRGARRQAGRADARPRQCGGRAECPGRDRARHLHRRECPHADGRALARGTGELHLGR